MFTDQVLKATINCAASGNNTLIAAPSAGRIAVDHINFMPTAATVITLVRGADTAMSGPYDVDGKQAFVLENVNGDYNGVLECGLAEAFILNSTVATQISGFVNYRIVDAY